MVSVRKRGESGVYHVMTRGVNKCEIFRADSDRKHYLRVLKKLINRYQVDMLAWCLMDNHVHLLPKVSSCEQLFGLMRDLNSDYSSYFNWRYDRIGHLMQGRYKSKPVDGEEHLRVVVRYIHQNPIGVFTSNCVYRWSSYQEYIGMYEPVIATVGGVLSTFGSVEEFKRFHQEDGELPGSLDPGAKTRLEDDLVHETALRILNPLSPSSVNKLPRIEKNANIRRLHDGGLSFRQIAVETGMSRSAVAAACKTQP